jgi:4-diphosphocytidyl-2-C-methyl-D-erythritol kinase
VVKPAVAIPTVAIFGSPLLSRNTAPAIVLDFLADTKNFGRNDLQPCAVAHDAEVDQALRWLERHAGTSRMSGSGSAVFAETSTTIGASPGQIVGSDAWRQLMATLPLAWTGRWCRGLDAHPLRAWLSD